MGLEDAAPTGLLRGQVRLGAGQLSMDLELTGFVIHHARAVAVSCLRLWRVPELVVGDAAVVVGELLANALDQTRKGQTPATSVELLLQVAFGAVVVVVHDDHPHIPTIPEPGSANPYAAGSRGLELVRGIATQFSFASSPRGGKDAFALIDHPRAAMAIGDQGTAA
ncbi:ATP-binding protein [Kitasatospora sp. NPDC096128]|uniref:ATP-binding protein n=1 Tax=Kitasatospora sp. NPDC096128 TaxID=3155547 RepID=UPI003332D5E5